MNLLVTRFYQYLVILRRLCNNLYHIYPHSHKDILYDYFLGKIGRE